MPEEIAKKAWQVCSDYERAIEAEVRLRKLPPGGFPALSPCNLLVVLDSQHLHIAFTHINAGGIPRQYWFDKRGNAYTGEQILASGVAELGMVDPWVCSVSAGLLDPPADLRASETQKAAANYVDTIISRMSRPRVMAGYEGLQQLLDRFTNDHPGFERNVFVAMRFRSAPHFEQIYAAIKDGLAPYGLNAHRADDKVYPVDGDLWNNVCVYMMGCKYGVCVFEEIDEREFNPNVPLEYGFLRAMDRHVLLLKEQRMPKLPSDITGKLFKPFDMMDIEVSVKKQVSLWAERDLGLQLA